MHMQSHVITVAGIYVVFESSLAVHHLSQGNNIVRVFDVCVSIAIATPTNTKHILLTHPPAVYSYVPP